MPRLRPILKTKWIKIRVSEEEDKKMKDNATAAGMNMTDFILTRCNAKTKPK